MLSSCCRYARFSSGYAVVLLSCSSGIYMLQLSLAVVPPSATATSWMFLGLSTAVGLCFCSVSKPWRTAVTFYSRSACCRGTLPSSAISSAINMETTPVALLTWVAAAYGLSLLQPLFILVTAVVLLLWWRAPCVCILLCPLHLLWRSSPLPKPSKKKKSKSSRSFFCQFCYVVDLLTGS